MEWTVSKAESGLKLVSFLKAKLLLSSKKIKEALDQKACTVNKRRERFASFVLCEGDKITFDLPEPKSLNFLFEDDFLIVVDKPAFITSEEIQKKLGFFLAHRLDKETSGALLLAKDNITLEKLFSLFKKREVEKEYVAIVDGILSKEEGIVENYLGQIKSYQGQTVWGEKTANTGLYSKTVWRREKILKECSLVKCFPETGRTHQIRIHLSQIGHPILGDYLYGKSFQSSYRPSRILLHASRLSFIHPMTQTLMTFESLLPPEFKEFL